MNPSGPTAVDAVRKAVDDATSATQVHVRTKHGVKGVYLRSKPHPAEDDEDRQLLRTYSPWFVLFPDAVAGSKPPSRKGGEHDYHPRPPEAFLNGTTPYVASPWGWMSGAYVIATTGLLAAIASLWLRLVIGVPVNGTDINLVLLFAGAMLVIALALIVQAPVGIPRLQARVGTRRKTDRLAVRRARFEPPLDSLWADRAWGQYLSEVVPDSRYGSKVYGRVVPAGDERYLQYWQFYVFNDWYNKHEADWEVVVIRLGRDGDQWAPIGAAYSSHFGGHWRPKEEVQWRDRTHPVVYVAQGSHAQYFESKEGGYTATLTRSFGTLRIQVGRTDWADVLAEDPDPAAMPGEYELAFMPAFDATKPMPAPLLAEWWWLGYRGLWGGGGAVPGPLDQGAKWSDPQRWVPEAVQRDSPGWDTLEPKAVA